MEDTLGPCELDLPHLNAERWARVCECLQVYTCRRCALAPPAAWRRNQPADTHAKSPLVKRLCAVRNH